MAQIPPRRLQKMKLYIDTSQREKTVIKLDNQVFEKENSNKKSQILLPFILETLEKEGKELSDISEIEVHTGPGSYTGLRVGISVANTLGWSLQIPVNGKKIDSKHTVEPIYS